MAPLLAALASSGLSLLTSAVKAKGKEFIEDKLGIKLEDELQTEEGRIRLRSLEISHEEFLINAAIEEKKLEIEAEKNAQNNVTDRWKADMLSDSLMSKNIRPLVLAYWTIVISIMAVIPINIDAAWIELIKISYVAILSAYFIGRSVEKHKDMSEKGKSK